MLDITYRRARSVEEAIEIAARSRGETHYLAGGTDLVVRAKSGGVGRSTWVDLTRIESMRGVGDFGDRVRIGAATTYLQLERSSLVRQKLPCLWQAVVGIGSPQVRALGTIGGNCGNASPAGDAIPPLYVYGAQLLLAGPQGRRVVSVVDFFRGPGMTILAKGELIEAIDVPVWPSSRVLWQKLGPRRSLACSKVSAAVVVELADGVLERVAIAFGAVSPTVVRALATEAYLAGKRPTAQVLEEAARLARTEVKPVSDYRSEAEYRREMAGTLVARALEGLCGVTPKSGWDVEMR